jgi:hypothetical protein
VLRNYAGTGETRKEELTIFVNGIDDEIISQNVSGGTIAA